MSRTRFVPALLLVVLPACAEWDTTAEWVEDYVNEDVRDMMTVAFQAGENAYRGDPVAGEDVVDDADAGNNFTVTYDLPLAARPGLGFGFGRVSLQVTADGVPVAAPLAFSFATTAAGIVVVTYDLTYSGEALSGRPTDVDLSLRLNATRRSGGGYLVDYTIRGHVIAGNTYMTGMDLLLRAPGTPSDGIVGGFGDGDAFIDDPAFCDDFDLDIDWRDDDFKASGDIYCEGHYKEYFPYSEWF